MYGKGMIPYPLAKLKKVSVLTKDFVKKMLQKNMIPYILM